MTQDRGSAQLATRSSSFWGPPLPSTLVSSATARRLTRLAASLAITVVVALVSSCSSESTPAVPADSPSTSSTSPAPLSSDESSDVASAEDVPDDAPIALDDLPGRLLIRDGSGEIVIIEPDGSEPQILSDEPGLHSQPTWSASGHAATWTTIDNSGARIEIRGDRAGIRDAIVVPTPPFFHAWSPDDEAIASLGPHPNGVGLIVTEVATANALPLGTAQPFFFDWDADGQSLVAAVDQRGLVRVSTTDEQVIPIETAGATRGMQAPRLLPDGDVLAVVDRPDGETAIERIRSTGSETVAIIDGSVALSLSPAADRLAVLTTPAQGVDVQTIRFEMTQSASELEPGLVSVVDLGDLSVTTMEDDNVLAIKWSPDGSRLGMLRFANDLLTWIWVNETARHDSGPFDPSPEFVRSYLPFADQYDLNSTPWSPDGRAFVFSGTLGDENADEPGIYVDIVTDGRPAVRVADGDVVAWSPDP